MKSLLISEEEKKDNRISSVLSDQAKYPHGLMLHIDAKTAEKLAVGEAPEVGEKFMIMAMAEVQSVSINDNQDDRKKPSFVLQITEMELSEGKEEDEAKSTSEVMYGV